MRKGLLLVVVVLLCVASVAAGSERLRIYHFDVDQADCTLLISPSGQSVLFDCGDAGWNSSRELREIAPEILALLDGKSLTYVVISHLHVDHVGYIGYGGLWGLIQSYGVRPEHILVRDYITFPGDTSTKGFGLWQDYLLGLALDVAVTFAELDMVIDLEDGTTLTVCSVNGNNLFPPNEENSECPVSPNELSLGVLVSYGEYQEWIGGDLGGTTIQREFGPKRVQYFDVESDAAARAGDVEVLRVNHHGSAYSTNNTFLSNLDPEVSIVSVGANKSYGHPDADVLTRLAETSDVYLTTYGNENGSIMDETFCLAGYRNVIPGTGTVVVETDGKHYWVNGKLYEAFPITRVDADGDGYYADVDLDDSDPSIGAVECTTPASSTLANES